MSDPLLDVRDLTVSFATGRGAVQALDGVSFSVEPGRTLAIVGESGSGKSVTVRTVMNLLPSTAAIGGDVVFDGMDLRNLSKDRARHFWGVEVAMVFQDPMTSLNPVKRIGAQLTEGMRFHLDLSKADAEARAVELLTQVGIPEPSRRLRQYPHELSGGMRQRVVIAMALACEPRLLIADEPTTALDVTVQKHILDLLGELQAERGMSMILITHDLGVAAGRADDIAVMYAGKVLEQAPAATLFADVRHPYTEALLESIPSVDNPSHTRLTPIPGRPPDLVDLPRGCRFAARCRSAQDGCLTAHPPLDTVAPDHHVACYYPVGTEVGRAARAANEAAGGTPAGLSFDHTLEVG